MILIDGGIRSRETYGVEEDSKIERLVSVDQLGI